jgi:VWFA-related protein
MHKSGFVLATVLLALPLATTVAENQTASQQGYVFRLDVRRVPVDIVVMDKQGNPVHGLTKKDFIVKENKKTQSILTFDYFDGSAPGFLSPKLPPLPTDTFVNLPREPERGPLYILYYDMVNTAQTDQMSFHRQLLEFVDKAQRGTRMALFVNADGLHLVQGFTSDHTLLRAAILSKGPGPHLPDVFLLGDIFGYDDPVAAMSNMKFLAEYMSGIPGRKNLLWLSGVFPVPVGPTMTGKSDLGTTRTVFFSGRGFPGTTPEINDWSSQQKEMLRETYAAMMRSQIAVYPVDVKGIVTDNDPLDFVANGQYADAIAEATGGKAFYGNNRVNELLDKALVHGENYYSLSYAPTHTKYDGLERHIEVTLAKKSGYTLNYRQLYYSVPDDETQVEHKPKTSQARALAAKAADTLYANIEHGAPMLHDLLFSAHLRAVGAPRLATAEQMQTLEDSPAYFRTRRKDAHPKPLKPVKLQKYVIDYDVFDPELKQLAVRKGQTAMLEFAAVAFDADGVLINSILNEGIASTDANPDGKFGSLFLCEQELEVPSRAAYIRIAVRDRLNDRTGTLEVPLPLKVDVAAAAVAKDN